MARWVRCGFSGSVSLGEYARPLGVGALLDLDEVVTRSHGRAVTLGDLLRGRERDLTPVAMESQEHRHG